MKKSAFLADALGHSIADKRIEILRLIDQTGSISQAAREAGVSYKAAWQAIDTLTNLAGINLLEKAVGGTGGGGARLTAAGKQLLTTADLLATLRHEVLHQLQAGSGGIYSATLAQLAIRTSMRNHLPCEVIGLDGHGQVMRVQLKLPGGETLTARITRTSAELLSLAVGLPVIALCKATAVGIVALTGAPEQAGMNRIPGRISRIAPGDGGNEISVSLIAGQQLVGFPLPGSTLALQDEVHALVDESAIVIALSA
ncbi:MAG: LysR family transcriptional regulator [Burkholderiaceae bacterium]|nr:LysR family transcriptional regulator [Burkholderiaceae bacterium]